MLLATWTNISATTMKNTLIASGVARITDGLSFDFFPSRLHVVWKNLHVFTLPLRYFFWTRLALA
jgi:hypothetical protein